MDNLVLTVPMRNGNSTFQTRPKAPSSVLTVPMRNGNEGWDESDWNKKKVLTVPMRNGNALKMLLWHFEFQFLPYLWGMETLVELLRNPLHCGFLPYLWGMETGFCRLVSFLLESFLPYLWGMETVPRRLDVRERLRSYRTYEEWKHDAAKYLNDTIRKFLPYLWGMETDSDDSKMLVDCTFLPYLWGMETC